MSLFSRLRQAVGGAKSSRSAATTSHHLTIRPGQTLASRFEIVRQLGAGQHSTVWLATTNNGPKALKILTDDVTLLQGEDAFELEVLEQVALAQENLGNKRLLQLQDHFNVAGEHGDHLCFVTDPLGISLLDVQSRFESKRLPLRLVKNVTRQLLEGLQVLHEQCKVVHTDIKSDNVLFTTGTSPSVEDAGNDPTIFDSVDIVLVDFGTAVPCRGPHTRLIQPVALRSPEVVTGCAWSYKADIWNLGCIVFELITGQHLFKPKSSETWSAEQYHLARMFATFSTKEVPQDILNFFRQGRHFEEYFNDKGLKISAKSEPLEAVLRAYNIYTPELCSFLCSMLQILPDQRLSAKELLSSEWLQ